MPGPGERERHWDLVRAYERFDAGRFEQALAGFETAGREAEEPPPAEALRRWGIAASEAGWPLAAYLRLRQYLAVEPAASERASLEQRIARARAILLETAGRQSRLVALAETRPSWGVPGVSQMVRLVGHNGSATVEALAGSRVAQPSWERAGQIEPATYMAFLDRLLDAPAWLEEWPRQTFDPNDPGPRRAVVLRLVVGEEELVRQALRGAPYEALHMIAGMVLEFARMVEVTP